MDFQVFFLILYLYIYWIIATLIPLPNKAVDWEQVGKDRHNLWIHVSMINSSLSPANSSCWNSSNTYLTQIPVQEKLNETQVSAQTGLSLIISKLHRKEDGPTQSNLIKIQNTKQIQDSPNSLSPLSWKAALRNRCELYHKANSCKDLWSRTSNSPGCPLYTLLSVFDKG